MPSRYFLERGEHSQLNQNVHLEIGKCPWHLAHWWLQECGDPCISAGHRWLQVSVWVMGQSTEQGDAGWSIPWFQPLSTKALQKAPCEHCRLQDSCPAQRQGLCTELGNSLLLCLPRKSLIGVQKCACFVELFAHAKFTSGSLSWGDLLGSYKPEACCGKRGTLSRPKQKRSSALIFHLLHVDISCSGTHLANMRQEPRGIWYKGCKIRLTGGGTRKKSSLTKCVQSFSQQNALQAHTGYFKTSPSLPHSIKAVRVWSPGW